MLFSTLIYLLWVKVLLNLNLNLDYPEKKAKIYHMKVFE